MFIFSPKARDRILASRWTKYFMGLALLQILVTIPVLIVALVIVETQFPQWAPPLRSDSPIILFGNPRFQVHIENIWFIVYEIWKLWLAIDGIIHWNSLTIIAAAAGTYFSGALGIMLIVETLKYQEDIAENLEWDEHNGYQGTPQLQGQLSIMSLKLYLEIAMTSVVWLLVVPVTFVAYMVVKDCGWYVYRRIGPELRLQNMYYTVQCFTLALKMDIFFEVFLNAFYAVCSANNLALWVAATVLAVLSLCVVLLGRKAIAMEEHWMISLFSVFQGLVIFINLAVLAYFTHPADLWYTLFGYGCASIVVIVFTLVMAVRCQLNFNRGLKPYVQIKLFHRKNSVAEGQRPNRIGPELPIDPRTCSAGGPYPMDEEDSPGSQSQWLIDEEHHEAMTQAPVSQPNLTVAPPPPVPPHRVSEEELPRERVAISDYYHIVNREASK